jgi:hypothetical protein
MIWADTPKGSYSVQSKYPAPSGMERPSTVLAWLP